jgi:CHAT domain-containing protein
MIGLPTSLLQAGVAGVLGTLWEVNDAGVMVLVRRFYQEWTQRPSRPAVALRRAQLWLRNADNQSKHTAFPDLAQLCPPSDPALRATWGAAHSYSDLQHWGAFSYLGW